jgi:undecaprenyl-diphosphatase
MFHIGILSSRILQLSACRQSLRTLSTSFFYFYALMFSINRPESIIIHIQDFLHTSYSTGDFISIFEKGGVLMDYRLFRAINLLSGRCAPIDWLMIFLSKKIRYVFIFVLIFMWFRNDHYRKVTWNAMVSSVISMFLHTLIKLFFFRPRPFAKRRVGILIPSKMDSSFPSKHTLLVFAVSTSIFLYDRALGSMMWLLSLLTAFSRIWLGHHYPSDILGSAFIATMTSIAVGKPADELTDK